MQNTRKPPAKQSGKLRNYTIIVYTFCVCQIPRETPERIAFFDMNKFAHKKDSTKKE